MINTINGKISLILGTDFFRKMKTSFAKLVLAKKKNKKEIVVKVGPPGSRECFTQMARMPYFCG